MKVLYDTIQSCNLLPLGPGQGCGSGTSTRSWHLRRRPGCWQKPPQPIQRPLGRGRCTAWPPRPPSLRRKQPPAYKTHRTNQLGCDFSYPCWRRAPSAWRLQTGARPSPRRTLAGTRAPATSQPRPGRRSDRRRTKTCWGSGSSGASSRRRCRRRPGTAKSWARGGCEGSRSRWMSSGGTPAKMAKSHFNS